MWSRAFRFGASHQRLLTRGAAAAAVTCVLHHHQRAPSDTADCLSWPLSSSKKSQNDAPDAKVSSSKKGESSISDYELGKTLGEGAFAIVKLATHIKTGVKFAMKLVQKSNSDEEMLQREIDILEAAGRHRHIVALIDRFDAPGYESWALVFDLVSGGEVRATASIPRPPVCDAGACMCDSPRRVEWITPILSRSSRRFAMRASTRRWRPRQWCVSSRWRCSTCTIRELSTATSRCVISSDLLQSHPISSDLHVSPCIYMHLHASTCIYMHLPPLDGLSLTFSPPASSPRPPA